MNSIVGTCLDPGCVNTLGSPLPLLPSFVFAVLLPSRQWPGTSLHIGVGVVLGHLAGQLRIV